MAIKFKNQFVVAKPLDYLVDEFLDTVMKESTHDTYHNQLHMMMSAIEEVNSEAVKDMDMLDTKTVNKAIRLLQKQYKTNTVKNMFTTFKVMLNFGVIEEDVAESVLDKVKKAKVVNKKDAKKQVLPTKHDITKLRIHMERNCTSLTELKYRTVIEIMYSAGSRISETLSIRWSDIDYKNKVVFVWSENTKTNKDYFLILSDTAIQLLKHMEQFKVDDQYVFSTNKGNKISRNSVANYLKANCEACGIKPINPHLLRKYCASSMLESGADIQTVSKFILHHENLQTTMKYILPNQTHAMDTIQKLQKNF